MYTNSPKITKYGKLQGESPSVSSQRKIHATMVDLVESITAKEDYLRDKKQKRLGKDSFDVRTYNALAMMTAFDEFEKTTNPKRKEELRKLINKYGRAILNFSARPEIKNARKNAEKKYIADKMLDKRHFTNSNRNSLESKLYKQIKENPNYDLTRAGTKWIQGYPLKSKSSKNSNKFNFNVKGMF